MTTLFVNASILMEPTTLLSLLAIVFMLLWGGLVVGVVSWMRWRRKTRWPFKESEKLLRSPGESLKRRITEMDELFTFEFLGTVVAAVILFPLGAYVAKWFGFSGWAANAAVLAGPLTVLLGSVWRTTKLWRKRASYFLGWFGERMTAECLRPLQLQGYRVFHDVPGESGKNAFNIDHVVVGPSGVSVVETKTRRKGNARPGFKDHEVLFDGRQLVWPWGEDRHGVEQTINEADWIRKWVLERTGLKVSVKRVLALPGWFVRETPNAKIRVVNPKILPDVIHGYGEQVLSAQQIDLIARQLDERCRDVME